MFNAVMNSATPPPIDFQPLATAITTAIPVSAILGLIGIVFAAAMPFVLCWLGARKVGNGILSAVRHGSLSV